MGDIGVLGVTWQLLVTIILYRHIGTERLKLTFSTGVTGRSEEGGAGALRGVPKDDELAAPKRDAAACSFRIAILYHQKYISQDCRYPKGLRRSKRHQQLIGHNTSDGE